VADVLDQLKQAIADHYAIERELGRGGMATVYLAEDLKHRRQVAIKVFSPELAASMGTERFLREVEVTANLNHPHILPLYDSGQAHGSDMTGSLLYYVMPYVAGESLRERLNREVQLPVEDALRITEQAASALDFAHRHEVVHRDIKPENILLQDGEVMLADFGIALGVTDSGKARLTDPGFQLGTPAYMSPEQVGGDRKLDGRSDIYSLACVLYEMLTGVPPFTGSTPQAVFARHMTDLVPPITTVRPSVSQSIATAINKALGKTPADRFATAKSFADALVADGAEAESETKSIVVLPFANLSPDLENEYFSDGLTEEIITDLSKIHVLRVISRNSAIQLKGSKKDTRAIGRELNVQYVLEGTVRKAEDKLRVTAQLIDVATDAHLWAEKYSGSMDDIFEIQEHLAREIVSQLRIVLTPAEAENLGRRSVDDPIVYARLLRARQDISTWSPEGLDRAIGEIETLIAEQGEDVTLLGEAARAHSIRADGVSFAVQDLVQAATYAARGLAADPSSREALHALAMVHWLLGDIGSFQRYLRRALELDPHFTPALMWGAGTAAILCKPRRARELLDALEKLDPLGLETQFARGLLGLYSGEFTAAAEALGTAVRVVPTSGAYLLFYATALVEADVGQRTVAAEGFPTAMEAYGNRYYGSLLRFVWLALLDRGSEALPLLRCEPGIFQHPALAFWYAWGCALLDERDTAFEWLRRAIDVGRICYTYYAEHSRVFAPLREDPRFADLMEEVRARWEQFDI
jgi:serine/threonine protein kinase